MGQVGKFFCTQDRFAHEASYLYRTLVPGHVSSSPIVISALLLLWVPAGIFLAFIPFKLTVSTQDIWERRQYGLAPAQQNRAWPPCSMGSYICEGSAVLGILNVVLGVTWGDPKWPSAGDMLEGLWYHFCISACWRPPKLSPIVICISHLLASSSLSSSQLSSPRGKLLPKAQPWSAPFCLWWPLISPWVSSRTLALVLI